MHIWFNAILRLTPVLFTTQFFFLLLNSNHLDSLDESSSRIDELLVSTTDNTESLNWLRRSVTLNLLFKINRPIHGNNCEFTA